MSVRLARPGEGQDVARLAEMALQGQTQGSVTGDLAAAVDSDGGRLKVPYGKAYALVADKGDGVVGLLYVTPPVRLVDGYPELGVEKQERMAGRLAELQLLAVDPEARKQGVGSLLLSVAEEMLRARGCGALLVKILQDDEAVQDWYRRRGFRIPEPEQPVVVRAEGVPIVLADDGDGYRVGIKRL